MDKYIKQIELMAGIILDMTDSMIKYAEVHGLTNTQEFLDILDELNEYSVKY